MAYIVIDENTRNFDRKEKIMKISIAQALKEKQRLAGEIACLWQLFLNENSCLATHKRKIDVKQTLQTIEHYTAKLVELKTKISLANQGEHLDNMQRLDAVRKQHAKLAETSGSEDPEFDSRGLGSVIERTAVFSEGRLETMRQQLRREADALQDKIDAHNAKVQIDFETPLK